MKNLIAVFLSMVLCVSLVGCTKSAVEDASSLSATPKTETSSTANSTSTTQSSSQTGTQTYTSTDGTPPVNDEMKAFYKEAAALNYAIKFGTFPVDDSASVKSGIVMYDRVNDSRFSTKQQLQAYLNRYFTSEFIEKSLLVDLRDQPKYTDINGSLYQMQMGRGGDMSYAGHVFGTVITTASVIKMPVKAYYAKNTQPTELFYTEPSNPNDYEIREYTFELVKENGTWKYNQFYSFT